MMPGSPSFFAIPWTSSFQTVFVAGLGTTNTRVSPGRSFWMPLMATSKGRLVLVNQESPFLIRVACGGITASPCLPFAMTKMAASWPLARLVGPMDNAAIPVTLAGDEGLAGECVGSFFAGPTDKLAINTGAAAIPRMIVLDFEALAMDYFLRARLPTCVAFVGS